MFYQCLVVLYVKSVSLDLLIGLFVPTMKKNDSVPGDDIHIYTSVGSGSTMHAQTD